MALHIEMMLLEVHALHHPDGGVVLRFEYPGMPDFYHHVSSKMRERSTGETEYRREDLYWLAASMRYEPVYESMSAHEKLAIQAAIVAAKARRARVEP